MRLCTRVQMFCTSALVQQFVFTPQEGTNMARNGGINHSHMHPCVCVCVCVCVCLCVRVHARCRSVVNITPRLLSPPPLKLKNPQQPLNTRLG